MWYAARWLWLSYHVPATVVLNGIVVAVVLGLALVITLIFRCSASFRSVTGLVQ